MTAGNIFNMGVADVSTAADNLGTLGYNLKSIKRYKSGKELDNLTTKVASTAQKWLDKEAGTTDSDKILVSGGQVLAEAKAPDTDNKNKVNIVVVIPRVAASVKLTKVTKASATGGGAALLSGDVCVSLSACTTAQTISSSTAHYFLNLESVSNKAAATAFGDSVNAEAAFKVSGRCSDITKCSFYTGLYGNDAATGGGKFWVKADSVQFKVEMNKTASLSLSTTAVAVTNTSKKWTAKNANVDVVSSISTGTTG